jgi:hypothetical protein
MRRQPHPAAPFDKDIRKAVADWHFSEVQHSFQGPERGSKADISQHL